MIGKLCPSLHTLVLPGILEHPDEVIEPIITYLPQLRYQFTPPLAIVFSYPRGTNACGAAALQGI